MTRPTMHLSLRRQAAFSTIFCEKPRMTVTKLVPSADADLACSTPYLPALPCRAFTCRHFVAEIGFVLPSVRDIESRNSLDYRRLSGCLRRKLAGRLCHPYVGATP